MLALTTLTILSALGFRETVQHVVRLHSTATSTGAILEVRVNRQLTRLLLDTGARDIVLSAKAAARCGLSPEALATVSGMTGSVSSAGFTSASIDVEGLQIANVPVRILPDAPVRQADGLIGAQVFRAFLVEIDAPRGQLRLLSRGGDSGSIPFREVGHMLFVRLDSGYALVDTGSSHSVIDRGSAQAAADSDWTPIRSATGEASQAQRLGPPARFDLGNGAVLWDRHPLAVDLSALSQRHGLDITAVIGYAALSNSVMRLDYLNRTLRIVSGKPAQ